MLNSDSLNKNYFIGFVGLRYSNFVDKAKLIKGFDFIPSAGGWMIYCDKNWLDEKKNSVNMDRFLAEKEELRIELLSKNPNH